MFKLVLFFISVSMAWASDLETKDFQFTRGSLYIPQDLRHMGVIHRNNDFYVKRDGEDCLIPHYHLDKCLQNATTEELTRLTCDGYLSLKRIGGEYGLTYNARLRGGGPIAGGIAYWLTKTLCYGTAVAATTTVVVSTGGAAGALSAGGLALATSGASTAVTVTGAAISGAGLASEAALLTTAVASSAGGVGGAITFVESASLGAWALFTSIPFLP